MNSEIEVVECGVHYRHRPGFKVDRPQGIENFVFVLVHTPVRICQCGKESVEPAGSCFLFAPHVGYWYSDTGGEFDNTWFHARGTGVKKLIHHLKLPLNRVLRPARTHYVVPLVQEMRTELASPDTGLAGPLAALAVERLFYLLSRNLQTPEALPLSRSMTKRLEQMEQIRLEMMTHAEQPWSVAAMAVRAHLSPSRFTTVYRRCFHVSPMEDVIRARLEKAASLLSTHHEPIRSVAQLCGFSDAFYFSRIFTRRFGYPPSHHDPS